MKYGEWLRDVGHILAQPSKIFCDGGRETAPDGAVCLVDAGVLGVWFIDAHIELIPGHVQVLGSGLDVIEQGLVGVSGIGASGEQAHEHDDGEHGAQGTSDVLFHNCYLLV